MTIKQKLARFAGEWGWTVEDGEDWLDLYTSDYGDHFEVEGAYKGKDVYARISVGRKWSDISISEISADQEVFIRKALKLLEQKVA